MNQNKEKLVIDLETVIKLYSTASKELKTILESIFGIQKLSPNLKDRIKTYSDVCKELNIPYLGIERFEYLPSWQRKRALYTHYLENIVKLFNEDWKVDFKDKNQRKYYCYFERNSSGWRLDVVDSQYYGSDCGSGFYFKNKEDAEYVGKQFIDIFSEILE